MSRLLSLLSITVVALTVTLAADPARDSAEASLEYLRRVMDAYHDRFPVSEDVSSAGNHFHAFAKIPDKFAPVDINGSWTQTKHSGATSLRCVFLARDPGFGGFYFQNGVLLGKDRAPRPNFGVYPDAGIDLGIDITGATALTFWARGERGGEEVEFFVAGVGRDAFTGEKIERFPDSSFRRPKAGTTVRLTTTWKQYSISLGLADLSYLLGGFGWVASADLNPAGAVFFLDDIRYELSPARRAARLDEPRFLRSFTTLSEQPDPFDGEKDGDIDFVLRNLAFTYDNALALLAFIADGSADSIRRARRIGDAFVYAVGHDRTYNDIRTCDQPVSPLTPDGARLRTAYAGGDIALPPGWTPLGRAATVPIPGFYDEATTTFYEVEQEAIDTGNNAWALLALTALYKETQEPAYLEVACRIGNFLHAFRNDSGTYRGFTGGIDGPESSSPSMRPWASSEHNLDLFAAFTALFEITGDVRWRDDAEHARSFVDAMWDESRDCYLAGTTSPGARNASAGQLPLDVQAWSVLSLGLANARPGALQCADTHHRVSRDGFEGFDFNEDRDGVWFEGTAQMVVAYAAAGRVRDAEKYRAELRRAQQSDDVGDGRGIPAASREGLSTGFNTPRNEPFKYFRRLHVGATAWNVFAQLGFNPYSAKTIGTRMRAVRH
ncbi:MAG TPA: hypothetical protein VGQ36_11795 [Thermoanaerobaculia bacterium]|jgi:hypothetical protein|nr:hypothetical protein [Thermoanaerobaculia bacterium]